MILDLLLKSSISREMSCGMNEENLSLVETGGKEKHR